MKFMIKSFSDKVTAVFCYFLLAEIAVSLGLAISCLAEYHFYSDDCKTYAFEEAMQVKTAAEFERIESYTVLQVRNEIGTSTDEDLRKLDEYRKKYEPEKSNVLFFVMSKDGKMILNNQPEGESFVPRNDACYLKFKVLESYYNEGYSENDREVLDGTIRLYIRSDFTANDGYSLAVSLINMAQIVKYPIIVLFAITALAALFVMGLLMSSVGQVAVKDQKERRFIDRIPIDLLLLISMGILAFISALIMLTTVADVRQENLVLWNAIILILAFMIESVILLFNITLASRIKIGHVYKNTMFYRAIAKARKLSGKENDGYFRVPLAGKVILTIGVVVFADIGLLMYFVFDYITNESNVLTDFKFLAYAGVHTLIAVTLIPLFLMMAINLRHIKESGQRIAKGDLDSVIDSQIMFGDFKVIGENLSDIQKDMIKAIDEKTKSQELRNELITNISHDLKTPLTSIINYADILTSPLLSQEKSQEYLTIIKNQSLKLDKLLSDLIDISKVSTGDMNVSIEPLDVGMFLEQTVFEFGDKFESRQLEASLKMPQEETFILADGKILWRVFENLLSNICKYAHEDTRVYLGVERAEDTAVITFKNISKAPLNLSGEELVQRFVRDDASRHTVGSGLGLAIAKSLTEIQNGKFDIFVDGDLFKIVLTFSIAPQAEVTQEVAD